MKKYILLTTISIIFSAAFSACSPIAAPTTSEISVVDGLEKQITHDQSA